MRVRKIARLFTFATYLTFVKALPSLGPAHTIYSGNYKIQECGYTGPAVKNLLLQLHNSLQPLISDSNVNPSAYHAFFGGVDPEPVQKIFAQIAGGSNLTFKGSPSPAQPQIYCVSPSRRTDLAVCGKKRAIFHNNAIGLCPNFFDWPLQVRSCGTTNAAKTAMVSKMPDDQYGALIFGLAYVYLGQFLGEAPSQPFIRNINDCINATPSQKIANPPSYYFYALSVLANCTDFPGPPPVGPPDRDRELLEASNSSEFAIMLDMYNNSP